ncbi:phosphoribosylamine--glycine ligase [Thermaurantimonas aggregans]|uniref:Phosphoribosylamine--glycine ligase n=1 Tax=Thermaurantimonas aggregans TaxID=2173829 RepID=A0A401XLI5_9FLAO|nr:phosphoribosylamine--glycine ligase [Thermaurantimonas aggregans]MCX8149102.1 phosphoribosylamine--glycine ligase [Thermaurantimonas aggregans]GCD77851.1 phosphoribosylamine--glycine ligase [Thermaurantimonas aggregans]
MKKILLLGSGGREYTMAWKLSKSSIPHHLFIAPGNGGTEAYGKNLPFGYNDFKKITQFVISEKIDLVIVGPEEPLVNGLADELSQIGVPVCGPNKAGAKLEGSKAYAKQFMSELGIPTAAYRSFSADLIEEAQEFLKQIDPPYVIKADGLAAGKGVLICQTLDEAYSALEDVMRVKKFGSAGNQVVIEQFLKGIEFSVFVATDGNHYVLLPEAKDYKRVGEGDTGLNTGGMGAVSPVPFFDEQLKQKVIERIIEPTLTGLKQRMVTYRGFIFFGLMNVGGNPYVIEYNCRLGDPETEVILPRLEEDFLQLCFDVALGNIVENRQAKVSQKHAATVMMVSEGYPEAYVKGFPISMPEVVEENTLLIHAGTLRKDNQLLTNGGRVLSVTALGDSLKDALNKSYNAAGKIHFQQMYFRRDIGYEFM